MAWMDFYRGRLQNFWASGVADAARGLMLAGGFNASGCLGCGIGVGFQVLVLRCSSARR